MMADEPPKDYSSLYGEDASLLTLSQQMSIQPPQIPTCPTRGRTSTAKLQLLSNNNNTTSCNGKQLPDGSFNHQKHRELQALDLREVAARLQNYPSENNRRFAMDALTSHYNHCFSSSRRKISSSSSNNNNTNDFRVYIQYADEMDTYVVSVSQNKLKSVKQKLPKRGAFRYFFKSKQSPLDTTSTSEEIEADDALVPFQDKDGKRHIYCQVFPL